MLREREKKAEEKGSVAARERKTKRKRERGRVKRKHHIMFVFRSYVMKDAGIASRSNAT